MIAMIADALIALMVVCACGGGLIALEWFFDHVGGDRFYKAAFDLMGWEWDDDEGDGEDDPEDCRKEYNNEG